VKRRRRRNNASLYRYLRDSDATRESKTSHWPTIPESAVRTIIGLFALPSEKKKQQDLDLHQGGKSSDTPA
jgi:hypothetical protein